LVQTMFQKRVPEADPLRRFWSYPKYNYDP